MIPNGNLRQSVMVLLLLLLLRLDERVLLSLIGGRRNAVDARRRGRCGGASGGIGRRRILSSRREPSHASGKKTGQVCGGVVRGGRRVTTPRGDGSGATVSAAATVHDASGGKKAVGFDAGENAGSGGNDGSEAAKSRRESTSEFNLESETRGECDDKGAGGGGEATLHAFALGSGHGRAMRRVNAWGGGGCR